jgi:hypothetical protein
MSKQYPGGIISKTAPVPSGPFANSTAPGIWTLEQQAYWQKLGQWPTAGNVANYIEDVFSTYLYTGNSSTQFIPNGINLGPNTGNSNYFNAGQINTEQSASAFDLGTSDWTVQCWIKTSYTSRIDPFELNGGTSSGFFGLTLNSSASGDIEWNESSGGSSVAVITATGTTVANGSWHNIAVTRSGNSVRLFFDGTQVGSTYTTSYTYGGASRAFRFGNRFPGGISSSSVFYISNFRVVKGTALYTTTFTPPTEALTQISGTSYLGAQSSSSLVDTTLIGNSYTSNVTPNGSGPFSYGTGSGGLVWNKLRAGAGLNANHKLYDTVRGVNKELYSNLTTAQGTKTDALNEFNASGFTLGAQDINETGGTYTSWTFREQAKFFDIVTYTGNGANRTISHSLGSTPGCIIVKRTDTTGGWVTYHRSIGNTSVLFLDTTAPADSDPSYWNNTSPTSTNFSVGTFTGVNANAGTYVAYLFAHDAGGFGLSGTDNVISCGSMAVGGGVDAVVNLGYEPQWVMFKQAQVGGSGNWRIVDNMRGVPTGTTTGDKILSANLNSAEADAGANLIDFTSTGFIVKDNVIQGGDPYIYIAIRRGPMAVPTLGTSVFTPVASRSSGTSQATPIFNAGFPVDLLLTGIKAGGGSFAIPRLTVGQLGTATTDAESSASATYNFGGMLGILSASGGDLSNATVCGWNFRRAPSFFDVVCYTGTGTSTAFNHNLTVVPEMIITKIRNSAVPNWGVWHNALSPSSAMLFLNTTGTQGNGYVNTVTSTTFSFATANGVVNSSGNTYVAYLFATCAGVSKVGSYTGTATTKQIDCGFTGGARFVLIRRTDSTGDWYVWDSARGIVAGNDPYLLLNSTAAEVTNTDYVDTYNAGFEISSTAPAAINASGGTFIFLAIA